VNAHNLTRVAAAALIGFLLLVQPAASQEAKDGSSSQPTSVSAIASAATSLAGAAKDRLLIKDLLGKDLTGADGQAVGTVQDFALAPGGRLVAALVRLQNGSRIAVPFSAIKLAKAA
jgi:hypothetical protein